jgi:hypothetical protein
MKRLFRRINLLLLLRNFILLFPSLIIQAILFIINDLLKPILEEITIVTYDKFGKIENNLWLINKPPINKDTKVKLRIEFDNNTIIFFVKKRLVLSQKNNPEYYRWYGPEIILRKAGFNYIEAKVAINYHLSTAKNGDIYICGRSKKYSYLLGLDKRTRDIFFHCWDNKEQSYIEYAGRTHLKDFVKGKEEVWVTLAISWDITGITYLIFDRNDEKAYEFKFIIPRENEGLNKSINSDSRRISLFGVEEFCIRTDIRVTDTKYKYLVTKVNYAKVRYAPLSFMNMLKIK